MQYFLGPQGSALFLLIAEIIILGELFFGFFLIRYRKNLKAHKNNQTTAVLINMVLILAVMVIGFVRNVVQGGAANPALTKLMIGHAAVGAVAELMGVYLLVRMKWGLPKWMTVANFKGMMRATLALWTLVAVGGFAVYYGQYVAATRTTNTAQTGTQNGVYGIAEWSDAQGFNDRLSITVIGVAPPSSGTVYQGWLTSSATGYFLSAGVLEIDGDGTGNIDYTSPTGNLLTSYDRILITIEQGAGSKTGPSSNVVLFATVPPQSGDHLRALLVTGPGTALGVGYSDGLYLYSIGMARHMREIDDARMRGNLATMKRHAEHVINLIEGQSGKDYGDLDKDGAVEDPGDGLGLLAYAPAVAVQAQAAADATDATAATKSYAPAVGAMTKNMSGWATRVKDDTLAIIAAKNIPDVEAKVSDGVTLAFRAYLGFDENGDGIISVPEEGGGTQMTARVKMMSRLILQPGEAGLAQNLRPPPSPSPPPATPLPPGTVRVVMQDMVYKDKTIIISKGNTVLWVNNDQAKHTVTADDKKFFSGTMATGATFSYTFNETGRFPYYCDFHGDAGGLGMAGLVIVE